jgi:predicted secreted Zn-dependent protease
MAHHDKLLLDFLKNQTHAPTPPAVKQRLKTSSKIMDPAIHAKPELTIGEIVEKKPSGKKVLKFLQKEIDAIMAETEA